MLIDDALEVLAERLRAIPDLTVTTNPRATVAVPMAVVSDTEIDYDESFSPGACVMGFVVTLYVSAADSASGYEQARRYLSANGPLSVRAALEDARGDRLDRKVNLDTGQGGADANYIIATFTGSSHVPSE